MKKHLKLLVLVLTLVLVIGAVAIIAGAEETDPYVCQVGDVKYTSLQEALRSSSNGVTIKLIKDYTMSETIGGYSADGKSEKKSYSLDLNGYTFTTTVGNAIQNHYGYDIRIIGEGEIVVEKSTMFANYSGSQVGRFKVIGSGKGIKLTAPNGAFLTTGRSNITFENVYFDIDLKNSGGQSGISLNHNEAVLTLNNCYISAWKNNDNQSDGIFYIANNTAPVLNINNSYVEYGTRFYFLGSGTIPAGAKLNIENSYITQKFNSNFTGDAQKLQAIYAPAGSFEVNIKSSTFEYAYRFLEVNKSGEDPHTVVNVTDNSTIAHVGRPYSLGASNNEMIRFGIVNFDATSKYVTPANIGVTHDKTGAAGHVQLAEGTRVSSINPFKNADTTYVLFPDGSTTLNSTTYTFAFDPATDSVCPYVVAKVGEEPATNKVSGGNYQFDNFEGMTSNSNEGYLYKDGDTNAYRGGNNGLLPGPYNMGGGAQTGTMMLVDFEGNTAVKYWAPPTEEYPVGTVRPITKSATDANKACLFVGAGASVDSTALVVYSVDIATDTDYFANIRFRLSCNMSQDYTTNLFLINSDGTITETTNYKQHADITDTMVPLTKLEKGEWYRVTAIADSAKKIIHMYVNGTYVGTMDAPKIGGTYNGFRLDIAGTSMIADSSLLMDNVSVATFETIPEGVDYKDLILNVKTNAGATEDNFVVSGKTYSDINEAFKAAAEKNTVTYLVNNVNTSTKVTENGTLVTAGYTMNVDTASIGYKNANGVYIFDSNYHVKYAFQTGTNADGTQIFTNAEIGLNVIPDAPEGSIAKIIYKKNEVNGKYQSASHIGWTATPGKDTPDTLAPVTMEDVENYDGQTLYLYPVYGSYSDMNHAMVVIDTATGNFKRGYTPGNNNVWGSRLRDELSLTVGETLVLCSSDVRWSDGFNQCKFGKGEVCIDLNGYTMNVNGAGNDVRKVSSFFPVKEGMTLNVYSSRQGGKIKAIGINDSGINSKSQWQGASAVIPADAYTAGASGGSLFTLAPAENTHAANNGNTNMNAHINIGVYKGMYAGNLTIEAANVAAANSGDKTCSITVDGTTIIRNSADFTAAIMTRFFYGTVTVKNSTLYSAVDYSIFGAHGQASTIETDAETGKKTLVESPTNTFNIDNCFIIVKANGGRIFGNDTQAMGTVTITNSVTNGNIQPSSNYKKNIIAGEGVCAYKMDPSAYAEGVIPAAYNVPMTVDGGSLNVPYIFVPKTEKGTLKYEADIQNLTYKVASYGATEAADLVLPLLAYKTVKAEDAVKVTFKGIGGNADKVVDYAKGGNVAAVDLDDATLNAFKLVFTGFEGTLPENVQENVTVTPTYEVKSNISGVKVNLSIYSDFVINLYVPVAYKNYIASITDGETVLNQSTVTLEDGEYIKVVIKRASNEATTDAVFTINLAEGEYTKAVTVTVSIASYAEAILEGETYTAEDKQLMYYMLTYANEAFKYFGDKTNYNATITALLETYATAKGEGMAEQTYAKAIENLAFGKVITEATVDLGAAPAFVFTVANGFEGTITVSYAGNTKTLTVKDGKAIVTGMKVYNFGADVIVTAEGTVNGENVTETATYNLDTFVKYHVNNEAAESQACVALLKALYDYVTCADLYTK